VREEAQEAYPHWERRGGGGFSKAWVTARRGQGRDKALPRAGGEALEALSNEERETSQSSIGEAPGEGRRLCVPYAQVDSIALIKDETIRKCQEKKMISPPEK